MSSPNQRKIIIIRNNDRTKSFFQISNKSFFQAMYVLKGNAFKLYCYLCDNKDGITMDLYGCDFCRVANLSNDTYLKAFKELEKQGYLIQDAEKKTVYYFMEQSKIAEEMPNAQDLIQTVDKDAITEALQKALNKRFS